MPFSIIRQAPECAAVASCYCAKPPQTGCCGSSGTPKEKTTTAAVAAVATATAAAVSQFSLQGVPHASAAKLPASIRVAKDKTILSVEKQKDGEELDDLHFTMKVVDLTTGLGAEQSTLVPVLGAGATPVGEKRLSWHQIRDIFQAIDEAWRGGAPWSVFPHARRKGRFAVDLISDQYGVTQREAETSITKWQQHGYLVTEAGKFHGKASGLRVVKYLESDR
jgi:hypothetical protein